MSNFIIGFFTLIAALSSIWLKDYLDQKKKFKYTKKQKAVQSYMLAGRLMHSLTPKQIICENLIRDRKFNYIDFYNSNPDNSYDISEKLELLIVENFYDLNSELLAVEKCNNSYGSYLVNIIVNSSNNPSNHEFNTKCDEFKKELVSSCHELRNRLINNHININSHMNIYTCIKAAKQFFSK